MYKNSININKRNVLKFSTYSDLMSQLQFTEINAGWLKNVLQPILSGHWCVEKCLYKVFSLLWFARFQEWTVVVASPGNVGWTLLGQMFIVVMGKELWYSHIIGWCYGTRDLLCNHDLWLNIERVVVRLEICSGATYFTLLSILLNKKTRFKRNLTFLGNITVETKETHFGHSCFIKLYIKTDEKMRSNEMKC